MRTRRWFVLAGVAAGIGAVCVSTAQASRRKATVTLGNQSDWERDRVG
jgi:hypothetical protein